MRLAIPAIIRDIPFVHLLPRKLMSKQTIPRMRAGISTAPMMKVLRNTSPARAPAFRDKA